jgi:hypothetical protein
MSFRLARRLGLIGSAGWRSCDELPAIVCEEPAVGARSTVPATSRKT